MRQRRLPYVGPFVRRIEMSGGSMLEIGQEFRQRDLAFVQDEMIHLVVCVVFGGKQRSARDSLDMQRRHRSRISLDGCLLDQTSR